MFSFNQQINEKDEYETKNILYSKNIYLALLFINSVVLIIINREIHLIIYLGLYLSAKIIVNIIKYQSE